MVRCRLRRGPRVLERNRRVLPNRRIGLKDTLLEESGFGIGVSLCVAASARDPRIRRVEDGRQEVSHFLALPL